MHGAFRLLRQSLSGLVRAGAGVEERPAASHFACGRCGPYGVLCCVRISDTGTRKKRRTAKRGPGRLDHVAAESSRRCRLPRKGPSDQGLRAANAERILHDRRGVRDAPIMGVSVHSCRATTTGSREEGRDAAWRMARRNARRCSSGEKGRMAQATADSVERFEEPGGLPGAQGHARSASGCSASSPRGASEGRGEVLRVRGFGKRPAKCAVECTPGDGDVALRRHPETLRPWSASSRSALT